MFNINNTLKSMLYLIFELNLLRLAVQQIFSHLRKIRSTKYPIQRGLRLVEAISRDLGQQLLKVSIFYFSFSISIHQNKKLTFVRLSTLDMQTT